MRGALLVAVALACAAVVAFVWLRRNGPEAGPKAPATSQTTPTATSAPAASPLPATPRPAARPPPELDRAALASPQTTVETELRLLEAGEQDLFRETFLPSLQPKVTAETFAACRKRVRQVPVRPDWEVAESGESAGHRVVRVSMFGKSMTGFHEVDGRWLADALWCVPVGLP